MMTKSSLTRDKYKLVTLRECGIDNFQSLLYSIIEELHLNNPWLETLKSTYSKSKLSEVLFDKSSFCPAIVDRSNIVLALATSRHDGGLGLIHWLGVRKEFRGIGLGSNILASIEDFFIASNCHGVELRTLKDNNSLESFYQSRGYSTAAVLPNYRFGVNAIHMIKDLEQARQSTYGGIQMIGAG